MQPPPPPPPPLPLLLLPPPPPPPYHHCCSFIQSKHKTFNHFHSHFILKNLQSEHMHGKLFLFLKNHDQLALTTDRWLDMFLSLISKTK
jgi:hypothetical protein